MLTTFQNPVHENDGYHNFIQDKTVSIVGFRSELIAFIAIAAFAIVQVLQIAGLLNYPVDEILIYGFSLRTTIPFLVAMPALHHITKPGKKFWGNTAVVFTTIYVVFALANYVVQLATVIPTTLKGLSNDMLLKQTPHSLFWDFDAIGYITMGFATLFAGPVFAKKGFQKWVSTTFLLHSFTTPLIIFVYSIQIFPTNYYSLLHPG